MAGDDDSAEAGHTTGDGSDNARAIEGEAELTLVDFASAARHLPGAWWLWAWPGTLLVLFVVFGLMGSGVQSSFVLPAAFVVLMNAGFQVLKRKGWVKQTFAVLGGKTQFHVDDYGLGLDTSLRQHRLAWASLARQVETPESFVVYSSPQTLFLIPKRAFEASEVDEVRGLLRSRVVARRLASSAGPRLLVVWLVALVGFLSIWHFLSDNSQSHGRRHKTRQVRTE
jgi:hypothetical protein